MLMFQGVGGLLRYSFHGTHEGLALAALIILLSAFQIIYKQFKELQKIELSVKLNL